MKLQKKALSFVVLKTEPEEIDGEERTKVIRSWTRLDMRGRGLATIIYQFLTRKLELKLVCDDMLSKDSIIMYKNFIAKKKFNKISYYNEITGKTQQEEPKELWNTPNDWRIFPECLPRIGGALPLNGHYKPHILGEMCVVLDECY